MQTADAATPRRLARLLGALVIVCLVLQQVALPMQLIGHGHSFHEGDDQRRSEHAECGHVHQHDQGGEESQDGDHPITDHLDQLADPTWNQVLPSVALHLEALGVAVRPAALKVCSTRVLCVDAPRPPPPRPGPALRGPPARV